ncbi:MAG: transposase [Euryarchaeota archaeon]|nr:transposase [Euryarchaeota archaeon]
MINTDVGKVFLATGSTDMRKSINGLAAIVQEYFNLDPFSSSLFVFCNKNHNKLKILQWQHNGFWLHYRRLEKGVFQWPKENNNSPLRISSRELQWLLDGLSINQNQAHKKVTVSKVI